MLTFTDSSNNVARVGNKPDLDNNNQAPNNKLAEVRNTLDRRNTRAQVSGRNKVPWRVRNQQQCRQGRLLRWQRRCGLMHWSKRQMRQLRQQWQR